MNAVRSILTTAAVLALAACDPATSAPAKSTKPATPATDTSWVVVVGAAGIYDHRKRGGDPIFYVTCVPSSEFGKQPLVTWREIEVAETWSAEARTTCPNGRILKESH